MMFRCWKCSPAIKINSDWQMAITSKKICVINGIASLAALYWVENFMLCNKHMRMLAKKVDLVTRNISAKILRSRLEEIWKSRELPNLEKLVSKKEDWFAETLQWAVLIRKVEHQVLIVIIIFSFCYRYQTFIVVKE